MEAGKLLVARGLRLPGAGEGTLEEGMECDSVLPLSAWQEFRSVHYLLVVIRLVKPFGEHLVRIHQKWYIFTSHSHH